MNATKRVIVVVSLTVAMALAFASVWAEPQAEPVGTAFTYQGQLKSAGEPVTDDCYMEFRLYADASGTSQVGPRSVRLFRSRTGSLPLSSIWRRCLRRWRPLAWDQGSVCG